MMEEEDSGNIISKTNLMKKKEESFSYKKLGTIKDHDKVSSLDQNSEEDSDGDRARFVSTNLLTNHIRNVVF